MTKAKWQHKIKRLRQDQYQALVEVKVEAGITPSKAVKQAFQQVYAKEGK